jgi:type VI secretion system protein ImpG
MAMNRKFLDYYNQELGHLRGVCEEFAREHPKIAGRLGIEGFECADPYVERLLEGFAYMAARVRLKVDAEFPEFTQRLLDMVYPDYLAPTPSMGIVRFEPDLAQSALKMGSTLRRGTQLNSLLGKDDQTACTYCTCHDVTLWPVVLAEARYLPSRAAVQALSVGVRNGVEAGLRLRFETAGGVSFRELPIERLALYVRGGDAVAVRLYEQLVANSREIVLAPVEPAMDRRGQYLLKGAIRPVGFDDQQALLPAGHRSFQGYRLLKEYFAFPERYMIVELHGLGEAVQQCPEAQMDLIVLFDRPVPDLEPVVDSTRFALYCTPAINLFERRLDRIHVSDRVPEHHVVPDRTRPLDFEIYNIKAVRGYGQGNELLGEFRPFYALRDEIDGAENHAYYTLRRRPRLLSSRQRQRGPRTSYVGSEMFMALVDDRQPPVSPNLRQLSVRALCTNRDLPLRMPVGRLNTDLTLEVSAPVTSVRFLAGPTEPRPAVADGELAWKLISHLALNHLSLTDADSVGAAALRELLGLYAAMGDPDLTGQIKGVRSTATKPIPGRMPVRGPVSFGRGLQVTLTLDEAHFEGSGVFLLGSVLEQFFARYVSINSFTQAVLRTIDRGEIMRWPARIGQRHLF